MDKENGKNIILNNKDSLNIDLNNNDCKDEERVEEGENISLENFDPLDPRKLINSIRSLKICKATGVPISKLYHTTYEEIKQKAHPLKLNDPVYLKVKYIETENQRQKLVGKLRELRKLEIREENKSFHIKKKLSTRSHSSYTQYGFKNTDTSIYKDSSRLDKTIILNEKRKMERTATKEILILMQQAQRNAFNHCRMNYSAYTTKLRERDDSFGSYLPKTANPNDCLKIIEDHYKRNKRAKSEIRRQMKLLGTLQDEQRKEMNAVLNRLNEYKRDKLLEKISNRCDRTNSLQRQKEELAKLRQEAKKSIAFRKHVVKEQIKKSMTQFKVVLFKFLGL